MLSEKASQVLRKNSSRKTPKTGHTRKIWKLEFCMSHGSQQGKQSQQAHLSIYLQTEQRNENIHLVYFGLNFARDMINIPYTLLCLLVFLVIYPLKRYFPVIHHILQCFIKLYLTSMYISVCASVQAED